MQVELYRLSEEELPQGLNRISDNPEMVLVFAAPDAITTPGLFQQLKSTYPSSSLAGCSTAGEIFHTEVSDHKMVVCEVSFDSSRCAVASEHLLGSKDSHAAGARLAGKIDWEGLKTVIVFGPGVDINGSAIVNGMASVLGDIPISGGLAGDNARFEKTFVLSPEGIASSTLCAIGLYGDALNIEHSCFGGWEPFGPLRKVTRHEDSTLHELDDRPALDLYKLYLGEYAEDLPASGLYFPLEMMRPENKEKGLIRTIMSVDDQSGSLVLAGDIDPDAYMRLMHASTDGLINGADTAASQVSRTDNFRLALLVSCVGRKLIMSDEVGEEVEAVKMRLGPQTMTTGFYSFGEICPSSDSSQCHFHNQTMTLTVISEGP